MLSSRVGRAAVCARAAGYPFDESPVGDALDLSVPMTFSPLERVGSRAARSGSGCPPAGP